MPLDSNIPDGALVSAALDGQREAFDQIVLRYQRPLAHVARSRLGRTDLAEDVVQETFLCAFRWLRTYDSRYGFRTWLWTILINQCARAAQRAGRSQERLAAAVRSHPTEPPHLWVSAEATPLEGLLARESADRVQQLLQRLPANQADALRLRFFGGLKFHEIAAALGCSLTTAKTWVRQGLLTLSQWLRKGEAEFGGQKSQMGSPASKAAEGAGATGACR
jgi:RNA polymerase sigma-70 factor (ECF subfamily)